MSAKGCLATNASPSDVPANTIESSSPASISDAPGVAHVHSLTKSLSSVSTTLRSSSFSAIGRSQVSQTDQTGCLGSNHGTRLIIKAVP